MKIGYFANREGFVGAHLERMSRIEDLPLILVRENTERSKLKLDLFIASATPEHYVGYWEELKKIIGDLDATKILFGTAPYCTRTIVEGQLGKLENIEFMEGYKLSTELNSIINKAK